MKKLLLLFFFVRLNAMEDHDLTQSEYNINNSVVFVEKGKQNVQSHQIQSPFQNPHRHSSLTIATIDTGISNKIKITIAIIGGCSTISAAIIAALVTYYTKSCS